MSELHPRNGFNDSCPPSPATRSRTSPGCPGWRCADDELDHFAAQLDAIIAAVAQVAEVAAEDIPPTSHALPLTNVFRPTRCGPCLTPEQALSGAPAVEDDRFRVPRILGEEA